MEKTKFTLRFLALLLLLPTLLVVGISAGSRDNKGIDRTVKERTGNNICSHDMVACQFSFMKAVMN